MFKYKKVAVVMPAYNAEKTLLKTYHETIEQDCVDFIILVDDASNDRTVEIAKSLDKVILYKNDFNSGYGANQKKCYELALDNGADIIVMVHPDYQYSPQLIPAMVSLIGNNVYQCVIGSRILGGYSLKGGMPFWKYISNRVLTYVENILIKAKLSEYHSGYRAYSKNLLESLDFKLYSDDFIFDNQLLAQVIWFGGHVAEITCPTRYFAEASSINFKRSVIYGFGCLLTALQFRCAKHRLYHSRLFYTEKENIYKSFHE